MKIRRLDPLELFQNLVFGKSLPSSSEDSPSASAKRSSGQPSSASQSSNSNDDDPDNDLPFDWEDKVKLGQGGFGTCYMVERKSDGKPMALKVATIHTKDEEQASYGWKTFHNELEFYEIMAEDESADWLPKYYAQGEIGGKPWILMELLGRPLHALVGTGEASLYFRHLGHEMLRVLHALHETGHIHRDVKPDNFVIRERGNQARPQVCLVDFGLAMPFETTEFEDKQDCLVFEGTFEYSSDRQLEERMLGPADDLESMGYVMLELYSGKKIEDLVKEHRVIRKHPQLRTRRHNQAPLPPPSEPGPEDAPEYLRSRRSQSNTTACDEKDEQDDEQELPIPTTAMPNDMRAELMLEHRTKALKNMEQQRLIPQFLLDWFKHCKSLSAFECPNYTMLRALLNIAPETIPAPKVEHQRKRLRDLQYEE